MRVSRREFIALGLLSASGFFYWRSHTAVSNNDLELFLANYEHKIPRKDVPKYNHQAVLFEKKLLSMFDNIGVSKTISTVNQIISNEYQAGRIQLMNGWIVSKTEFRLLLLYKKYV
jgi:hypothetical protein